MAETQAVVDQEFKILDLGQVVESKTNPRKTFDPKGMEDLIASVREKGVIVPILVRPVGSKFEVVAGARRYRAAKKVGLGEIPAIIRELSDDQALEAQVIENLQRQDVHPLEEAEGFKALLGKGKYDVEAIAVKIGKSPSYVYMRLKLTELAEPAQKAFLEQQISASHAEKIARLQADDQKTALELCVQKVDIAEGDPDDWGHKPRVEKSTLSVKALQKWIDDEIHTDLAKMPWDMSDPQLLPAAGSCAACPKRSGNAAGLFPEIQKDSICTDRACFKDKFNAWIDRQIADFKAQKVKCIVVVEEEHSWRLGPVEGREGIKRLGQWHRPGKRKCRNTGVAVVWNGKSRGQVIEACTAESCAVHNPKPVYNYSSGGGSKEKTPAQLLKEQRDREAQERKRTREAELTKALFLACLEKAPAKPGPEDLRPIAVELCGGDIPRPLFQLFPELEGYGNHERQIAKLQERDLWKILFAFTLSSYGDIEGDLVAKAAKRWKVDLAAAKGPLEEKWAAQDKLRKAREAEQDGGESPLRSGLQELLDLETKKASRKFGEPTCGRCLCKEAAACDKHSDEDGDAGAVDLVVVDRSTNHGICANCVTPEELGRLNAKARKAGGPSVQTSAKPKKKAKKAGRK